MSGLDLVCVFCLKSCKSSDSRPYPTLKSDQRIHNRCQLKKNLADKRTSSELKAKADQITSIAKPLDKLQERFAQEEKGLMSASSEKRIKKLSEIDVPTDSGKPDNKSGQYFFDLKAGIAKPHEKRRYLHHKRIADIAARYDEDGFKEEAIGRTYDHAGKDLSALGEESGDEDSHTNPLEVMRPRADKRKTNPEPKEEQRLKKSVRTSESSPCWFCLSSDKIDKHLILTIGQYCYLALAKGGLLDNHLMIMPIEHIRSISDEKSNSKELLSELDRFKDSLVSYFEEQSKGVVFFERNFKSVHWQLQAIPVPIDDIVSIEIDIKSISKKYYKNSNYVDLPDSCPLGDRVKNQDPYFFWQIEPLGSRFFTPIDSKDPCHLQLGRMILSDSSILNCPDKVDWKTCIKTREEYEAIVDEIKKGYMQFDITRQFD